MEPIFINITTAQHESFINITTAQHEAYIYKYNYCTTWSLYL